MQNNKSGQIYSGRYVWSFLSLCVQKMLPISGFVDAKIGKRNCYKEYFEKFMARKPGIHGHKQLKAEKACYNKPRN